MTSSNYFKCENNICNESDSASKCNYGDDVIELVNLNSNGCKSSNAKEINSLTKCSRNEANYNKFKESSSDIEIIGDTQIYNNDKLDEIELLNKDGELIRGKGVYFEYYLGCIETDSIILSSEICDVKDDKDISISYEITPKSTKRSYSPMYNLKINNHYISSNDYIKIIGRNIPNKTQKGKKKAPQKKQKKETNDDGSTVCYDMVSQENNKFNQIISSDKKYVEMDKYKCEVLKDINEGYPCIRLKHNNRDVSKLKSHLSKTLSVLLVLNAIRIEIKLEKVSLCDFKFGGSLKTCVHVILYPDSFKIDVHKYHEYNSLIKQSVNNLFKELNITPLRLAKNVSDDSFDDLNTIIVTGKTFSKNNGNFSNKYQSSSVTINTNNATSLDIALKGGTQGSSATSQAKDDEEILDTTSENEIEEKNEDTTNLVFVEEKYRGGYLLEEFKEIYPNSVYFKPTLKTYQAEGIWWMYLKENPPEYLKENISKGEKTKEIDLDQIIRSNIVDSEIYVDSDVSVDKEVHSDSDIRVYSDVYVDKEIYINKDVYVDKEVYTTEEAYVGKEVYADKDVYIDKEVYVNKDIHDCEIYLLDMKTENEPPNPDIKIKDESDKENSHVNKISNKKNLVKTEDYNNDDDNDIRNKEPLNPMWEEHAFIPNIKIYEEGKLIFVLKYFYVNKITGCLSLTYPQYVPQFRGGILADEMGLGKTIQSIGLIAHDIYQNKLHIKNNIVENKNNITYLIENTIKGFNYNKGGTLIIAPLALIYQWKQEIDKHTKKGFISSYIYYGNSKDINSDLLSKYSVVLTTYSTLVSEYKNTWNKKLSSNPNADGQGNSEDNIESKFSYTKWTKEKREQNEKPEDVDKFEGWSNNEQGKSNGIKKRKLNTFFMKTGLNNGKNSMLPSNGDKKTNKVLNNMKEYPLYKITWRRIIIDEAHVIKNKNSIQSIAVWKLRGERKWCLTGTPIQNSLYDIFPLLRFLGIKPYGNIEWWNKEIADYVNRNKLNIALDIVRKISSPILLRRTKNSKTRDGHNIITLPKKNVHILKLKFSLEEEDFYRAIFYRSKTKFDTYMHDGNVLSHYSHVLQLLLRLRQCCSHPLLLFSKPFFEEWNEEDIINEMYGENSKITASTIDSAAGKSSIDVKLSSMKVEDTLKRDTIKTEVLEKDTLIYNFLQKSSNSKNLNSDYKEEIEMLKNGTAMQCVICLEDSVYPLISKCLHIMCKKCADYYFHLTQIAEKKCPGCDNYISLKSLKTLQQNKSPLDDFLKKMKKDNFVYSTKLRILFDHIKEDIKNELHVVVFSQWIGFLKIIEKLLTLHEIPNKVYDGSLTYEQRKSTLYWFNIQKGKIYQPGIGFCQSTGDIPIENKSGKVLLCSLKAGGVGLNLTVSSKVYLMDLWWNPAIEDQAFERIHRIGQLKDVNIYKFVLEKTVEERILQIHQNKQYTANQCLAQVGNTINTDVNLVTQKLGMDDFILMFKDWN
ncbi:DNA repair protein RAD5, putative [Plasmodium vinckei brucechwatti]|uniref:DNA repair protein RAD5, putative n=1 Tax=Plasmodium vinckei brucechwatti TaxID=119398 RepID=A0A6V7SRS7_PLAVN|nr:DNA repair protein RAD5, putative [Plasmodium vinckei brucechwatti]